MSRKTSLIIFLACLACCFLMVVVGLVYIFHQVEKEEAARGQARMERVFDWIGQGLYDKNPATAGKMHCSGLFKGQARKKEPDFSAYIAEMRRAIRRNWSPPVADEEKRVVILFKVDRQGKLLHTTIQQSGGTEEADRAALIAIQRTVPLCPLASSYSGKDIDIQFIFDYEVQGKGDLIDSVIDQASK